MARECIANCPRIKGILGDIDVNNLISGPGPIHPDLLSSKPSAAKLLEICADSYGCQGPRVVHGERTVGPFWNRRKVQATFYVCGLDGQNRR